MTINYKEIPYGFEYGSMQVDRLCSDEKRGWAMLRIASNKQQIQVYATKTGKIRVFRGERELK